MIVQPDVLTHWKTQALAGCIGLEKALVALLSLWGHCQTRRAWEFELEPMMLAGICQYRPPGDDPEKSREAILQFWHTMIRAKLIEPSQEDAKALSIDDDHVVKWWQVHDWGEMNAALVIKWGARQGKGFIYPARGSSGASIDKPSDGAKAVSKAASNALKAPVATTEKPGTAPPSIDTSTGVTIGLDRIGLELNTPLPPEGGESGSADLTLEHDPGTQSPDSKTDPCAKKKKGARQTIREGSVDFPEGYSEQRRQTLLTWLRYKQESRKLYTPSGFAALLKRLDSFSDEEVAASVNEAMSNQWAGVFPERLRSSAQKKEVSGPSRPSGRLFGSVVMPEPGFDWRFLLAANYPNMAATAHTIAWASLPSDTQTWLAKKGGQS